ncbi:IS3 family transposase [Micromonospora sp. NPDC005305]|uniref:IS3 family transposase n=1 Tax=Micromonospora sp. NPDC005305 TaxID=3156875 RepID=UPI0033BEA540
MLRRPVESANYTSFRFAERLQDNGILPSMGSVGESYDNALMENFWSTLKIELVYRTSWRTRDVAEDAIFAYIDGWYNTRRIQKELGYAPAPVASAPQAATGAIEVSPFVPYAPTPLGDQSDLDLLATDQRVRGLVREALREIIAAEGPVEQHRLARLALARFGFLRTREDRRLAVLALVDARRLYGHPTVGRYAWPEGTDPQTYRAYQVTQASNDRPFEDVPPEEIANAFVDVLQSVPSMDEERLLRAGLERLGYRRRTDKVDKLLRYGLHVAVTSGRAGFDQDGRLTQGSA